MAMKPTHSTSIGLMRAGGAEPWRIIERVRELVGQAIDHGEMLDPHEVRAVVGVDAMSEVE